MRSPGIYHNKQNHPKPRINGDIAIFPSNYIPLAFQKKCVGFKFQPTTHTSQSSYRLTGTVVKRGRNTVPCCLCSPTTTGCLAVWGISTSANMEHSKIQEARAFIYLYSDSRQYKHNLRSAIYCYFLSVILVAQSLRIVERLLW